MDNMMMEQELNHTRLLPVDMLTQIFCRLKPRDLAISRAVCIEWKDIIDDCCLLCIKDLLPHSIAGIFINFVGYYCSDFFRPWRRAHDGTHTLLSVDSLLSYLPEPRDEIIDHCNGLLLFDDIAANPATGWWAPLPPRPAGLYCPWSCIGFDPTVSSHYSVFIVSHPHWYQEPNDLRSEVVAAQQWPASPYLLHVFSSRTGRWEERPFLRDGEAAGAIGDVGFGIPYRSACWEQALYVLCSNSFILRISLSKDEYQVIRPPAGITISMIGKSEKGVYVAGYSGDCCLKVWILNGSSNHEHEWVLKHDKLLKPLVSPRCYLDKQVCGPWILEDTLVYDVCSSCRWLEDHIEKLRRDKAAEVAAAREKFGDWNSDDEENFVPNTEDRDKKPCHLYMLGFHPFKEVIFMNDAAVSSRVAVAYCLNSSKFQYLGNTRPTPPIYDDSPLGLGECIVRSFVYTPCKLEVHGNPGFKESSNG